MRKMKFVVFEKKAPKAYKNALSARLSRRIYPYQNNTSKFEQNSSISPPQKNAFTSPQFGNENEGTFFMF